MRRAFGFQQQSHGMRQDAQQQSYSMHQEAAWHSKDYYYNNHISGVQIVPSLCLDSQLMKHTSIFDGNQALQFHNGIWDDQMMNQNGWSSSGSGTNNTYYNPASGARKLLPVMDVTDASHFSHSAMFNNAMENAEYETRFHQVRVPATVRVQEMRYERSVWGDHDGLEYRRHFDDGGGSKRSGFWSKKGV